MSEPTKRSRGQPRKAVTKKQETFRLAPAALEELAVKAKRAGLGKSPAVEAAIRAWEPEG